MNPRSVPPVTEKGKGMDPSPVLVTEELSTHAASTTTRDPVRSTSNKGVRREARERRKQGIMHDSESFGDS